MYVEHVTMLAPRQPKGSVCVEGHTVDMNRKTDAWNVLILIFR